MDPGCSGIRIMGQSVRRKRNMDTTGGSIGKLDATIATSSPPSHEQRKRRGKDYGIH